MERILLHEMEQGISYNTKVMVSSVGENKVAANGTPFTPIVITDGQKNQKINIFDYTREQLQVKGVIEGAILDMNLMMTPGNKPNTLYYNVNSWEINKDLTVTKADFIKVAPIDLENSFNWIIGKLDALINERENNGESVYDGPAHLTKKMLIENKDDFLRFSAAVSMHHNYIGGLLYHTTRMVSCAWNLCKTYSVLNKELLVCGAVIHDIGKLLCLETSELGVAEYTVEGNLFEHAIIGYDMIKEVVSRDTEHNYDPEMIRLLQHLVTSHHGKQEWGATATPKIPEAVALHLIDMIDSRINMFEEAYVGQETGTMSAERVYGLENSFVYKPKYLNF